MNYIVKSQKEYVCVMQLHCDVSDDELINVINEFNGTIYQRPPVRSSVKRRLRTRVVFKIEELERDGRTVLLRISSEPGTYMRKICHDIGIIIGCGAHMRELRRTRSGIFTESTNLVTLHEVSEALYLWKNCKYEDELRKILIPVEMATCGMPKIVINDHAVSAVAHGASLMAPGIVAYQNFKKGDVVGILTLKGELVAIGQAVVDSNDLKTMEKGKVIKPNRIFIDKNLYPRFWKKHTKQENE
ncbi:MAG: RNA-guided pseudouridylation complex pseudouridine synthase subunit Cbf5 [Sulfolobaceae archaeon]|nr:RNA-guided pseudouridylation complex pseudouridine synthase subunit Cbf5 [Sulfolobaceae archaeon]